MELQNFRIGEDHISLEFEDMHYDLHNDFNFRKLNYNIAEQRVELYWTKRKTDWVPANLPDNIVLIFNSVDLFKAKERDQNIPFTEDDCLSSIGFLWNDLINEMGGVNSNEPQKDCTHLSLAFMSGFAIKIGAELAFLKIN